MFRALLGVVFATACSESAPTCRETIDAINNALHASRGVPWGSLLDERDCETEKYSAELRRCIVKARTEDAVIACARSGPTSLQESLAADRAVFERNQQLKANNAKSP